MKIQPGTDIESDTQTPMQEFTYKVDKMTFIVTPKYQKGSKKTIHDLLLGLMKNDINTTENRWKH